MNSFKRALNISGWLTFIVAFIVYIFAAERTGSLWDCGEFILGAYKLQVVHPPGASLFLITGRIFTMLATMFSSDPADIGFSVNLMSSMLTAFAGMFVCWSTMYLGKLSIVGRGESPSSGQNVGLLIAGLIAGLSTTFSVSIWFSAVEGEVYAMSTFFTALTLWALLKWYYLPDTPGSDRWLVFSVFMAGLSIGVHLLSILTFPALALFYYLKKYPKTTITGFLTAVAGGLAALFIMQKGIIVGLPALLFGLDKFLVNDLGMPFYSGLVPFALIVGGFIFWGLRYAAKHKRHNLQLIFASLLLVVAAYSVTSVAMIRANANPPINMNNPSDPGRLLPYINREQYGDRPLLFGPSFMGKPVDIVSSPRYERQGDQYVPFDDKIDYVYRDEDEMFFPRMGHGDDQNKIKLYEQWMGHTGKPSMGDNLAYFFRYQVGWMYWRYFMWNFAGRQNFDQGYWPGDKTKGQWLSGISFIDNARLGDQSKLPDFIKNDQSRNTYFLIPLILGLIGVYFHAKRRMNDFLALALFFLITGIGIIVYSNQPPIEPRERDYVLVGSFFTFCIWIGLGAFAIGNYLASRMKSNDMVSYGIGGALGLLSPLLLVTQNMDDMGRKDIYASRDYAANFLNSVGKNGIIFTYGDNDTYPLWYAQEVEGIRPDVRVINLSLIAVDWYIDQQRRRINQSDPVKMTIPKSAYAGKGRNLVYYIETNLAQEVLSATSVLKFIGEDHPIEGSNREIHSFIPTKNIFIGVDKSKLIANNLLSATDNAVDSIPLNLGVEKSGDYVTKDELAVLDIIANNINDRPIYFSVTTNPAKFLGLNEYLQLEGLALRVVPVKTPPNRQFGIFGLGRVASDTLYNNITQKFKWGNFDKKRLYIDKSYMPTINAMRLVQVRSAYDMLNKNMKDKAVVLAENTLKVFPDMNLTYDSNVIPAIALIAQAGQFDKAKPYLKQLAENTRQWLVFYNSLTPGELLAGYDESMQENKRVVEDIYDIIRQAGDTEFEKEMDKILGPYRTKGPDQQMELTPQKAL